LPTTLPARVFSMGSSPASTSPPATARPTSRKFFLGTSDTSGPKSRCAASSLYAPSSPWNATDSMMIRCPGLGSDLGAPAQADELPEDGARVLLRKAGLARGRRGAADDGGLARRVEGGQARLPLQLARLPGE